MFIQIAATICSDAFHLTKAKLVQTWYLNPHPVALLQILVERPQSLHEASFQ